MALVWATQIKAYQGEHGATLCTWQLGKSHTLCCFKGRLWHFCYDQYKTAPVVMKLWDTYLLSGFTNISNRLQSCGKLVKKHQGHSTLCTSSWARKDDTKLVLTGTEILVSSRDHHTWFLFLCSLLTHHSQSWCKTLQSLSLKWLKPLEIKSPDLNIFCHSVLFHFVVITSAFPLPVTVP